MKQMKGIYSKMVSYSWLFILKLVKISESLHVQFWPLMACAYFVSLKMAADQGPTFKPQKSSSEKPSHFWGPNHPNLRLEVPIKQFNLVALKKTNIDHQHWKKPPFTKISQRSSGKNVSTNAETQKSIAEDWCQVWGCFLFPVSRCSFNFTTSKKWQESKIILKSY